MPVQESELQSIRKAMLRYARTVSSKTNHIVKLVAAWVEDGQLHQICERGLISLDQCKADKTIVSGVLNHIGQALAAVHGCGLVHSNVRPANIWLFKDDKTNQPIWKLADFDFLAAPGSDRDANDQENIAPELLADGATFAADVYALATSVSSFIPLTVADGTKTGTKTVNTKDKTRAIIDAMLSADPSKRPAASSIAFSV